MFTMVEKIGIEIKGQRYVKLFNLDKAYKNQLLLTTISNFQKRAIIKIFLFYNNKKETIDAIEIKNIPLQEAGSPTIKLFGEFDGEKTLFLKVMLNNKIYAERNINLKSYLPKKRRSLILIPTLLIIVVVIIFIGLRSRFIGRNINIFKLETTSLQKELPEIHTEKPEEVTKNIEREKAQKKEIEENKTEKRIKKSEVIPFQKQIKTEIVYFKPSRAFVSIPMKEKLDSILPLLSGNSNKSVKITGHCALYGTEKGRFKLSVSRAKNVYEYLRSVGWKPNKKPQVLGMGGEKPVTEDPDNQYLNRRVEIEIDGS